MTDVSLTTDRRMLPERRVFNERRSFKERRNAGESKEIEKPGHPRKFPLVFELLCLALIAAAGLAMYKATGLCDAVNSTVGHIVVGGGIIWGYMIAFRRGLHRI